MKRLFFYLIMMAAIVGTTILLLFIPHNGLTLMTSLKAFVTSITNGTFSFGTSGGDILIYGLVLFILMNAATILTMLLIFLFTGFRLRKINRFYRICIWYLVSAILFSATYAWYLVSLYTGAGAPSFDIKNLFWACFIPLASSLVVMVLGIIFHNIEKRHDDARY